jgi:integrase
MTTQKIPSEQGGFRRVAEGLYQYESSKAYYARFRHKGERIMERLGGRENPCTSLPEAKRLLRDLKTRLERVEIEARKKTFKQILDEFEHGGTKEGHPFAPILTGKAKTLAYKKRHLKAIREHFPRPLHTKAADISPADIARFLASYNDASYSHYNQILTTIRDVFAYAVKDQVIAVSPVQEKYKKVELKRKRVTPSVDEFERIVAQVRGQKLADTAQASADLLEFMGLAGLGQAECNDLRWGHINLTSGRIVVIRKKTGEEFTIPIYPQLRPLIERMNRERQEEATPPLPTDPVFSVKDPKKSLATACQALGLPSYSPRSLRRMFVTRALELGISAKIIAGWQGHGDGGSLILKTYSHVRSPHETDMAALLAPTRQPSNVTPIAAATA